MQNCQTDMPRYIEIDGEQITVTEEQYRAYKRPLWAEHKRRERESRCRDAAGVRCKKTEFECRNCPNGRSGRTLSLEQFADEGFEIPDYSEPLESLMTALIHDELDAALSALEAESYQIIKMLFFEGLTERQTADRIGLSQKGVNKRKHKILEQLRDNLKNF
jgi:RNA polymerase sigma factor (sigma-70 family)